MISDAFGISRLSFGTLDLIYNSLRFRLAEVYVNTHFVSDSLPHAMFYNIVACSLADLNYG